MKAWLRVSAGVLAAGLFFVSAGYFRRAPDPVFEGRLASAWLNDLLSPDYQTRTDAQEALEILGEAGVPQLRILLQRRNSPWNPQLARLSRWLPWLKYRPADAVLSRQRGAAMAAILGVKARAALPDLVDSLGLEPCAAEAERALLRSGGLAIPVLEKALRDGEPAIRERSAKLLGELKRVPDRTAAALMALAADDDAKVRRQAARALGGIECAEAERHIGSSLVRMARDREGAVRAAAFESMGRRAASEESLAAVRAGLADGAVVARLEAAKAHWQLRHDPAAVLPVLTAILATREGWQAAYALAELGAGAAPAIPALVEALRRERVPRPFRTPPSSAFAIGQIGAAAIPALRPLLEAADGGTRMNAVLALGFMGRRGHEAVADLLPRLSDRDPEVRHTAALTLAAIGAAPEQVLAGLSECLGAEDIYMRSAAAQVLREIAPDRNWVVNPE